MKKIGLLKTRSSRDIESSRIGVGFECLDRKMWDDTDECYRLVGNSGVKHARVQTGWSRCETEKGRFDFAWLDRIVNNLLERGIAPWFNLSYGNINHTGASCTDAVGSVPLYSEEARQAWKTYVSELVQHFRDRISHYEIWNEPDIPVFWNEKPDADEYMELLRQTVPVIKKHQPSARIIGGATAYGMAVSGFALLEEYLKEGIVDLIDVYSYHRYLVLPELHTETDFRHLRAAFDAYGGQHVELWQAESGCPSRNSSTQALSNIPFDEEIQAKVLCRSILTDLSLGVDYTCFFHFSDFKCYYLNGHCKGPNYFGLITCDDPPRPKLSYEVFTRLCTLFDSETRRVERIKTDLWLKDMKDSREKYSFHVKIATSKRQAFERNGYPLISVYLPVNLFPGYAGEKSYQPCEIEFSVWTSGKNFNRPVLIDPLTGEIFELDGELESGGRDDLSKPFVMHGVLLKDYPVFITDRENVADFLCPSRG